MAVTSLNGSEDTINDFVQEVIRSAQLKVKLEDGVTTNGLELVPDKNTEEIEKMATANRIETDACYKENNISVPDRSLMEVKEPEEATDLTVVSSDVETNTADRPEQTEVAREQTEAESKTVPENETENVISSEDCNEHDKETMEEEENIILTLEDGNQQRISEYIQSIILSARQRAEEELKSEKKKRSRGGSSAGRGGAVRELVVRLFRRLDHQPNGTAVVDDDKDTKSDRLSGNEENTEEKRRSIRNLFSKKQKYKVASEQSPDDNDSATAKKRRKPSRVNSLRKSFRNLLSCSSSVTTV